MFQFWPERYTDVMPVPVRVDMQSPEDFVIVILPLLSSIVYCRHSNALIVTFLLFTENDNRIRCSRFAVDSTYIILGSVFLESFTTSFHVLSSIFKVAMSGIHPFSMR
jgi:hypothetical protein